VGWAGLGWAGLGWAVGMTAPALLDGDAQLKGQAQEESESDDDFIASLCRNRPAASTILPHDSSSEDEFVRDVCRGSAHWRHPTRGPAAAPSSASAASSAPSVAMAVCKIGGKMLLLPAAANLILYLQKHPDALANAPTWPSERPFGPRRIVAPTTAVATDPAPVAATLAPVVATHAPALCVKSAPATKRVRSSALIPAGAVLTGKSVPHGPLELPNSPSTSEEGSDEDRTRGDCYVESAGIAHIMRKRLSKAEKNGIGIAYCTLVSFNAVEEDVLRYAVDTIDGELTRRGGCMFKVGITHGPYFRFLIASSDIKRSRCLGSTWKPSGAPTPKSADGWRRL
jgi:hypothetical protein